MLEVAVQCCRSWLSGRFIMICQENGLPCSNAANVMISSSRFQQTKHSPDQAFLMGERMSSQESCLSKKGSPSEDRWLDPLSACPSSGQDVTFQQTLISTASQVLCVAAILDWLGKQAGRRAGIRRTRCSLDEPVLTHGPTNV